MNQPGELRLKFVQYLTEEQSIETNHFFNHTAELVAFLESIDWRFFSLVTLSRSENDLISIGGSTHDGISCVYELGAKQVILDMSLNDIEEITSRFTDYFLHPLTESKIALLQRAKRADLPTSSKREAKWRQSHSLSDGPILAISVLVVCLIAVGMYFWYTEEWKFIGYTTQKIDAHVDKVGTYDWGKGIMKSVIYFSYTFDGKEYEQHQTVNPNSPKAASGCRLRIKIATKNPNRAKVIGHYKSCK